MSDIDELKDIYYKSGIWLKYNWYDFLKEFLRIANEIKK